MRLFESKIGSNTPTGYKPKKKLQIHLKVDLLNTKLRRRKIYQRKDTLRKLDHNYVI